MQNSGADLIMARLVEEGTDAVFLVPGAQIDPPCRRLSETPAPQAIVASHELSAGFMADGYAHASRQVGVCSGIGSCGAANMLPAVAVAAIDCSPVLFLSGNIPNRLQGCGAFQDGWAQGSDDSRVFSSFVRHSESPKSSAELRDGWIEFSRRSRNRSLHPRIYAFHSTFRKNASRPLDWNPPAHREAAPTVLYESRTATSTQCESRRHWHRPNDLVCWQGLASAAPT